MFKDKDFYINAILETIKSCDSDTLRAIYEAISNIIKKK